jgi:hypothetical protein
MNRIRRPLKRALRATLASTAACIATAGVLACLPSALGGQTGSSLQQQLQSQFTLTKLTPDGSDIATQGAALVLQKKGVWMYGLTSPQPPLNTYKNGKLSKSFSRDMAIGLQTPGGNGLTSLPMRSFEAGEKSWVVGLGIEKDGIVFRLYSEPYDGLRYYGDLKFAFDKGSVPSLDQALALIANVLTIQPAGSPGPSTGASAEGGAQQSSVAGRYEAQGGAYIELSSDGSFTQQVAKGIMRVGFYTVDGEILLLKLTETSNGVKYTIRGDTISYGEKATWTRHGDTPPPPPPLKLPATFASTQSSTDQLQLNADNSLSLQVAGQSYHGTFSVNGNILKLAIAEIGNSTATIDGNKLTDSSGQTWVLQDKSAVPIPPAESALRNQDIIDLVKAGIDDATILAKIASSKCQFDTSTAALINLKKSGVSAAVTKAMVGAGK